jgi:hypothetical protein
MLAKACTASLQCIVHAGFTERAASLPKLPKHNLGHRTGDPVIEISDILTSF